MADTYTANYGWTLPEPGASRDTWGQKLNNDLTSIDQLLYMAAPIGVILDFAGVNAPPGWLIADGRLVSRVTYSALFAVIGTIWGAGDGSTTFALPNCNGRAPVGPGSFTDQAGFSYTYGLGGFTGSVNTPILQQHLPNYTLTTGTAGLHNHTGATAPGGNHYHTTDAQGSHNHGGTQWNQTGLSLNDPGHQHGYYQAAQYGGAQTAAGANYILTNVGAVTSVNATGITINDPGHVHGIAYDGSHTHITTWSGNLTMGITSDGNHSHTVALGGGGQAFQVLNPIIVVTKIIYAGSQAAAVMAVSPAVMTIEHEPLERSEIEELREEIAQLKALLMPPPQRRALSSPVRGPH